MKARLLICVVALVAFLAISGTATADTSTGMTCGGRVDTISALWDASGSGQYTIVVQNYCGTSKSYMWELQHNTSAHPQTWTDFSDSPSADHKWVTVGSGCNGGCQRTVHDSNTGEHCSSNWPVVRVHFWWQGGDTQLAVLNYC